MRAPVKLLFVVNVDWYFLSHRTPFALAAKEAGMEVAVAAADTGMGPEIRQMGLEFIPLPWLEEKGTLRDELRMVGNLTRLYREVRPDLVHHVTMRPVLYGSIAARRAGVKALVNLLAGLGYLYTLDTLNNQLIRLITEPLFRYGFSHPNHRLILQNGDDRQTVLERRLLPGSSITVIRGSGVDTERFRPAPQADEKARVSYFGRLLWSKGLHEFIDAAKIVGSQMPEVEFHLYGEPYPANPLSVEPEAIEAWKELPNVRVHGKIEDVAPAMQHSSVICLPTMMREGVPMSLIEGAASGKPLLTTDLPGCREIVVDGLNGYLVPAGDERLLAERILYLMSHPGVREEFGRQSRKKAVEEFAVSLVVDQTMEVYRQLLGTLR